MLDDDVASAFDDPSVLTAAEACFVPDATFSAPPVGGGGGGGGGSLFGASTASLATSFEGGGGDAGLDASTIPARAFVGGTLDEPVRDTLLRDARHVGAKLYRVVVPFGSQTATLDQLRDWDLWGPLLVSLSLAASLAAAAPGDGAAAVFSDVFAVLWVGAVVVTVNAQLLGGALSLLQSVCVLGYSVFPVVVARFAILAIEALVGGRVFFVRLALAAAALVWSTKASVLFIAEVIHASRRSLAVFPVVGFYSWLCWMIVII